MSEGLFATLEKLAGECRARPLVTLAWAQSLDGSIAAGRGHPLTLSNPASMRLTHRLRAWHDGILVGIGTVLSDDPRLTAREVGGAQPRPVVLDSHLRLPPNARLLAHPQPPLVLTAHPPEADRRAALESRGCTVIPLPRDESQRIDLPAALDALHARGIRRLMVEGGARVLRAFLQRRLADLLVVTVSMQLVGGLPALAGLLNPPLPLAVQGHLWLEGDLWLWGATR